MNKPKVMATIEYINKYGLEEAILIEYLQNWIKLNKKKDINNIEGRTWTFGSASTIMKQLSFMNISKIKKMIKSLRDQNVIITNNFNKRQGDKTLWFAFIDEKEFIEGEE